MGDGNLDLAAVTGLDDEPATLVARVLDTTTRSAMRSRSRTSEYDPRMPSRMATLSPSEVFAVKDFRGGDQPVASNSVTRAPKEFVGRRRGTRLLWTGQTASSARPTRRELSR